MDKFNLLKVFKQSIITYLQNDSRARKLSFTMAEILLSLTIIGVVAAITLPSLTGNINERMWATQKKALYSRMSQAIAMMPALNGYGTLTEVTDGEGSKSTTVDTAAETFVTNGLAKVLKINNVCDSEHIKDCGFPEKFMRLGKGASKLNTPRTLNNLNGYFNISIDVVQYSQINTKVAAFETQNGESILVYYNPNCSFFEVANPKSSGAKLFQPTMCANFIYDLNGLKGPNQVGKDIGFITAFYPSDSVVVAPIPISEIVLDRNADYSTFSISQANKMCRDTYGDDAKLANIEELKSIWVNNYLGSRKATQQTFLWYNAYISSTVLSKGYFYVIRVYDGSVAARKNFSAMDIFCVK